MELLKISAEDEQRQRKRLDQIRHERSQSAVDAALAKVRSQAGNPDVNLMPALIEAVTAYATLGEIMATLEAEFGRYVEVPVI